MKSSTIVMMIVVMVIVGGASFWGGMKYQQNQRSSQFAGRTGQTGANGFRNGNNAGMRPINGQIIASDNHTITVKMADGSSKIVILSGSTQINKAAAATQSDLQTGVPVAVFGTTNSDGSVTAQNIQLNPMFRMGGSSPSASVK